MRFLTLVMSLLVAGLAVMAQPTLAASVSGDHAVLDSKASFVNQMPADARLVLSQSSGQFELSRDSSSGGGMPANPQNQNDSADATKVPAPATVLLVLAGLVAMVGFARRARKA